MKVVRLVVFDVKLTTFYTGGNSNYTNTYPKDVTPKIPFYRLYSANFCHKAMSFWFSSSRLLFLGDIKRVVFLLITVRGGVRDGAGAGAQVGLGMV